MIVISEVTVRSETEFPLAVKNNHFQALQILVGGLNQNSLLELLKMKEKPSSA